MGTKSKFFFFAFVLVLLSSATHKAEAGSVVFRSSMPSTCGGVAEYRVSTDKDVYDPGETIALNGSWVIYQTGSCGPDHLTSVTAGIYPSSNDTILISGSRFPDTFSGSLAAPRQGGTYRVTVAGSTTFNNQTVSGTGYITINVTSATILVNSTCPPGATFEIQGNNSSYYSSPAVVGTNSGGVTYTMVSYTAPNGYRVSSITPTSLVTYPFQTYTINVTCVQADPTPTVNVWADNPTLSCPMSTDIHWTSNDATSCSLSWDSSRNQTSGVSTVNVPSTTTYTVTCTGASGLSGSDSVTVNVTGSSCLPPPEVTVTATPSTIDSGQSSRITWSSTNGATSCTPNFNWTSSTAANNSTGVVVNPLTFTRYGMTCVGPGGSGYGEAGVTVNQANISVTCTPSSPTALIGQSVTWTGTISGGVPPYSLTWSGPAIPSNPAPRTSSFNIIYSTVGIKTALLEVVDSNGSRGSCNPPGSMRIYFDPQFKEI